MNLLSAGDEPDQYSATRWRMRRAISLEGVKASGTLPEVLPAQVIKDTVFPTCQPGKIVTRNGYYWDGLYSQNPPVRELLDAEVKEGKPDEIWVVRINPQELYPSACNRKDRVLDHLSRQNLRQRPGCLHALQRNRAPHTPPGCAVLIRFVPGRQ